MANELFKAKILAELDTSQFDQKMNGLLNQQRPIKLKIDLSSVDKQLSSIEQRLRNLGNININPFGGGSGGSGGGNSGRRQLTQTTSEFTRLLSVYREMGQIRQKLPTLNTKDNGQQIAAMQSRLSELYKTYTSIWSGIQSNGGLSMPQLNKLGDTIDTTTSKVDMVKAKVQDAANVMQRELGEKAAKAMAKIVNDRDTGKFAADIAKVTQQYERLASTGHTSMGTIQADIQELTRLQTAMSDPTQAANLTSNYEQYIKVLDRVRNSLSVVRAESSSVEKGFSFGGLVKQAFGSLTGIVDVTSLIRTGVRMLKNGVKEMIQEVTKIDTAMTQLKIVTRASSDEYKQFYTNTAQTSKQIGIDASDLIDSATTYARLGYSLDESGTLAKYTGMLQNVGDIDVSSAQSAITAITKAFGVGANEIESVMDKMVIAGNNFPISVAEIATGMNNAGSMLASAGNSLEQTIALLTAANVTTQDISKSSTGLRTIAARIRKTTTELDELGETMSEAKYEELVNALTGYGVKLTENGQYRSTYDILKDIAAVWDDISSMDQAALAETLAGKHVPGRTEMCA